MSVGERAHEVAREALAELPLEPYGRAGAVIECAAVREQERGATPGAGGGCDYGAHRR